jgi:hypothetical protein
MMRGIVAIAFGEEAVASLGFIVSRGTLFLGSDCWICEFDFAMPISFF